ncbi:MAG: sulfotransferase, partial [Planctomycetes bacterium]|nr:sulfotransferase [Planctomycetota bacterium]
MAWQDKFLIHFGPGPFSGITLREWFLILRENRFSVDSPHWLRAAAITLGSLQNSAIAGLEKAIYGRKIESAEVHPPLFVLGLWRSGTTHLHNLLSRDDRFAFPSIY